VQLWTTICMVICTAELVGCLIYFVMLSRMPEIVHLSSMGTVLAALIFGVCTLGIASSFRRSRQMLNLHVMGGILTLIIALNFTSNASRDVNLYCNMLMMDMNLQVAEKAMAQMNNAAVMESISARLRELDNSIVEADDVAHSLHKAKQEQRAQMRDDYYILESKVESLRRHAAAIQEQVLLMAAKIHEKETPKHEQLSTEEAKERAKITLSGEKDIPEQYARHIRRFQKLFADANEILESAHLPRLHDAATGEHKGSHGMKLSPSHYYSFLETLKEAVDEIVKLEKELSDVIGEDDVKSSGKGSFINEWRKKLYAGWRILDDYIDDDYLMENDNPIEMLHELHQDADDVAARLKRYKHNLYESHDTSEHSKRVKEARHERRQRQQMYMQQFQSEMERADRAQDRVLSQWDRSSHTCSRSNEVVPQLVGIALGILFLQAASTYTSISLIFLMPVKRVQ